MQLNTRAYAPEPNSPFRVNLQSIAHYKACFEIRIRWAFILLTCFQGYSSLQTLTKIPPWPLLLRGGSSLNRNQLRWKLQVGPWVQFSYSTANAAILAISVLILLTQLCPIHFYQENVSVWLDNDGHLFDGACHCQSPYLDQ